MSTSRFVAILGLFLLGALGDPAVAMAQSVDVVVQGVVRDQTGAVRPGATVTVTGVETGLVRLGTADASGRYRVPPVPAGVYDIKVELAGFRPQIRTNQPLNVGQTITIDFTFDSLARTDVVEVVGASMLETTKNTLSRTVGKDEIDTLPVADRNFNGLASLVPGVTPTGIYGGVDISGSRDFQNGYNVDGVSAEGLGLGDQRLLYAQDWIQEFQVLTSQYNVEFGRASGGILNAITRSGSNITSGRAYGYFQNELWNATPAFAASKAPLQMNRLGGTVGGSLAPERIFYFGGLERFDSETTAVVNTPFPAYNGRVPVTSDQTLYLAKLEYHPNQRNIYRVRYNGDSRRGTNDGVGGNQTQERGMSIDYSAHDLVGTWSRVVSPTAWNELRAAWSGTRSERRCNFAASHPAGPWFALNYPGVQFGCPQAFGRVESSELQLIDNVTWTGGRHEVKAGLQVSRGRSFGDYRFAREGAYSFESDTLFDPSDPATYPSRFLMFEGPTTWDYPRWSWGAFVQDSWRLSPRLTLNTGIRYDLDGSYTALNSLYRVDTGLNQVRTDRDNVAPRVGLAWTPFDDTGRTLVRGGVGVYYDENHEEVARLMLFNSILAERSTSVNATIPGLNPFCPTNQPCTGERGQNAARELRQVLAEALAQNGVPTFTIVGGTPDLDSNLQIPYTIQASVGLARTFGRVLTVSVDGVFARGLDQYTLRDANVDRDATLAANRIVRVNPNYSFINRYENEGEFDYRALQVYASYTPSARHLVRVSYTLSANESNTHTALRGLAFGGLATNPLNLEEDRGPTYNDVRHNLGATWITTLPFDVQVSGILSARSALPWSVVTKQLDADPFLDRPEPRNSRRGDNYVSLDLRLSKAFPLGARRSAALFAEVFNVTNATNLTSYVGTLGAAQFALPTEAFPKRRFQLGFRIEF